MSSHSPLPFPSLHSSPLYIFLIIIVTFLIRLAYLTYQTLSRRQKLSTSTSSSAHGKHVHSQVRADGDLRVLAVLGSGGHTAEMLTLLHDLFNKKAYSEVHYIISSGDNSSGPRAKRYQETYLQGTHANYTYLPRARRVGESFLLAAPRAALCFLAAFPAVLKARPHILLCNGPGTSAVVAIVTVLLNAIGLSKVRILYVESVARVHSLSLSGVLLYPFAHRFLVQWQTLKERFPLTEFYGRLS